MTLSLPADPSHALRLTGVVPELLSAIEGGASRFRPVQSAILFVVDGLGAHALGANAGYARFLASRLTKKSVATTVFPSTTAAALTSLLTGTDVGEHGIVGYRAREPETDRALNQLTDWGPGLLDPLTWQRSASLLTADRGYVVSRPEYAGTGFTAATMRDAGFHGERDLDARVDAAAHWARSHPGSLVYLYAPELDGAGHKHGMASDTWLATLESVDAAARRLHAAAGPDVGIALTADHGMIDVPRERHVLLAEGDPRLDGVRTIAGEPRMLHLYAEPGMTDRVRSAWAAEESRSWVMTRDDAIAAGLFGARVSPEVRDRIGDVLVAARARIAYYDDRLADSAGQKMVGQHGSLTADERTVPLLRLGAFAD
ncbi:alkaline phosphatase family protein [Microbacterium caowuchunii]|uniref:Alkaline phosphatase family protein n=1 Tax=Microbacterium caowuchunii TaxID=2614638 RepID=A0A5N0TQN7_9MICO|nr:alkaline phosphatase family protein [Microbacterium caowuchunii]KAA9135709.1 alkaline phosphatase family protein [Microbacterium caowuchunii]